MNESMRINCGVCGKEIVGVENLIDAGDDTVCSQECLQSAIARFQGWQNSFSDPKLTGYPKGESK